MKWDGHSHSELCPHGPADSTALLVERAIALGFTHYSITEHAPLPKGFYKSESIWAELALKEDQLADYFTLVADLKRIYQDRIQIRLGLEIDYLPGLEDYTRGLLAEVGPKLEDALLSLHFLPTPQGLEMVDFSAEDFRTSLLEPMGGLEAVHRWYWQQVLAMVQADLGPYKPKRYSHLGLIQKFSKTLGQPSTQPGLAYFPQIVESLQQQGAALDFNMAGLGYAQCGQAYVSGELLQMALAAGVPLVYGSDAHGVAAVGQFYNEYACSLKST